MEDTKLELPLDIIKASCGFSLDIGGSMAKLVYRSKEDFTNGVPKDTALAAQGKGVVRQRMIVREKIADVIDFIRAHCDITVNAENQRLMYTTGLGGNQFQVQIEQGLNIKLENIVETDGFASALSMFLRIKSPDELFEAVDESAIARGEQIAASYRAIADSIASTGQGDMIIRHTLTPVTSRKPQFPVLVAVLGSGFGFIKLEESGHYTIVDIGNVGGRLFLGLTSFLTGVKDFNEIAALIRESDGRTVDTFASECTDKENAKDDVYSKVEGDLRTFPFGKGQSDQKDKATKGDLIHSLLETLCDNTAVLLSQMAQAEGVAHVYFCGNFVTMPKAKMFLTSMMHVKKYQQRKQVDFEFMKNGGYLGAIGCFTHSYDKNKRNC